MTQPLSRLFVPTPLSAGAEVELPSGQSHYLNHVLRLPEGAQHLIFNGQDGEWLAVIAKLKKRSCIVQILERVRQQTAPQDLEYLFAPLKQARLDYLIQKAVEMGVSSLQPVLTARTVAGRLNLERVRANAVEAAEQCGILTLPEIRPVIKLGALLRGWPADRSLIFCDEAGERASPIEALSPLRGRKIAVLVGPEGGFAPEERQTLLAEKFVCPISLGPRIMRADTAAVAALAIVNAVLGDWRR